METIRFENINFNGVRYCSVAPGVIYDLQTCDNAIINGNKVDITGQFPPRFSKDSKSFGYMVRNYAKLAKAIRTAPDQLIPDFEVINGCYNVQVDSICTKHALEITPAELEKCDRALDIYWDQEGKIWVRSYDLLRDLIDNIRDPLRALRNIVAETKAKFDIANTQRKCAETRIKALEAELQMTQIDKDLNAKTIARLNTNVATLEKNAVKNREDIKDREAKLKTAILEKNKAEVTIKERDALIVDLTNKLNACSGPGLIAKLDELTNIIQEDMGRRRALKELADRYLNMDA